MTPIFEAFSALVNRVAPGLILGAAMLYLTRREPRLRIVIYLALFILLRDAMTPLHMWAFGSDGVFWIRLHGESAFLVVFGVSCLALSLGLYYLDQNNQSLFRWIRGNLPLGLLWGALGMIVVVAPFLAIYRYTPIEMRGGTVPAGSLAALLIFALLGNLLEEALFRGYVLGYLAETMAPMKAGIASGLVFAFCHIYLAATVTDVGYTLLLFTIWEGVIVGLVGANGGVIPSTLTHGGAIFLLSSGLL
ncbi:MAG: CPBP family intramembrane metalloprotease [Planctomycetes bacterium]|nr:CPBP family intramembrane metalloprotease [Planctomycetota bacterium]